MRYSINSRFRGTILGLAIGARLGKCGSKHYLSAPSGTSNTLQITGQSLEPHNYSSSSDAQIINLALTGMKSLIQKGRFYLSDWHQCVAKDLGVSPLNSIIATLPIALFYHENEIKLHSSLQLALTAVGQDEPENRDIALAVGYAIAQALQAPLHPLEIISRTTTFVGASTILSQKLSLVKIFLEHNAGIETVATALEQHHLSSSLALAFYCWLSSLEDFRLTIRRVMQNSPQPQITCAITGALSGAYNGTLGIPATLQQPLFLPPADLMSARSMTTQKEMLRLCDALVAVWSGVYDQANQASNLTGGVAIAAPRVITR